MEALEDATRTLRLEQPHLETAKQVHAALRAKLEWSRVTLGDVKRACSKVAKQASKEVQQVTPATSTDTPVASTGPNDPEDFQWFQGRAKDVLRLETLDLNNLTACLRERADSEFCAANCLAIIGRRIHNAQADIWDTRVRGKPPVHACRACGGEQRDAVECASQGRRAAGDHSDGHALEVGARAARRHPSPQRDCRRRSQA